MGSVDKRGRLREAIFDYEVTKDAKVFIYWQRKQVMTLKDRRAGKFLAEIDGLDAHEAQLLMAKVTGNFKHGNER
ncbi:MAG: hypothetical protein K8J31_31335 [Anaerolineae bacterium]|nr:hypothetical protein [Anaerolineae bacterium]